MQLVSAVALGYPDEAPGMRYRKKIGEILEFRGKREYKVVCRNYVFS